MKLSLTLVLCFGICFFAQAADDEVRTIQRNRKEASATAGPVWRALVIGINDYRDPDIKDLRTPVADAREVAAVLTERYGFVVTTLLDDQATWRGIDDELRRLVDIAGPEDSVLVYFGGHGDLDLKTKEGWWYPVDARRDDRQSYLKNIEIRQRMKQMPARHVLLVSDSCFAGTLFSDYRSASFAQDDRFHRRLFESPSRLGLTAGGNEPVLDGGGDGHSVFARYFLGFLQNPAQPVFSIGELYREIAPIITNNSPQKPEFLPVLDTGHERGEFVFISKGSDLAAARPLHVQPAAGSAEPGSGGMASALPVRPPAGGVESGSGGMSWPVVLGCIVLFGAGGAGFLLVRPRLARRRHADQLRQACAGRDAGVIRGLLAAGGIADEQLVATARALVEPVAGLSLKSGTREVRLAPGPRQALGRWPLWPLGVADPHVSRKAHCWITFEDEGLSLVRDTGKVLVGGEDRDQLALRPDDRFVLAKKSEMRLRRLIPRSLCLLQVIAGPDEGVTLAMGCGEIALADLLKSPDLAGSLSWRDGRPCLAWPAQSPSPLPYWPGGSPVLLQQGDLLRADGHDWQVRLMPVNG